MAIALRNKQMLALFIIAILLLLTVTFIALSMAHIDLWHISALFFHPNAAFPHM